MLQVCVYCRVSVAGIQIIVLLLFGAEVSDCIKNTLSVPFSLLHVSTDLKSRMSS